MELLETEVELLVVNSVAGVELLELETAVELLEDDSEVAVELLDSVESDCSLASLAISGVSCSRSSDKSCRVMLT